MKKIIAFACLFLLLACLGACAQIRNTPPQLVGVEANVTVTKGDAFDPLTGITATDEQDGDLTSSIVVEGFNEAWLSQQGTRTYIVSVTDSEGLIAQVTVTLNVISDANNKTPVLSGVFNNQSFYIGSNEFDPIRGVTATDAEDGDLTDQIQVSGAYSTTKPGKYTLTVEVTDSDDAVATATIILTVKSAVTIPTFDTQTPVTIRLWHANGDTIETALKRYAQDFHTLYPNVTVDIVKTGNNYDELRETTISTIRSSGVLPNIVQNYPDHVMEYIDNNAVVSITPYIDSANYGYGTGDESFLDILETYRRENSQYTVDGEYYSVPFNKSTEVVIYNKTLFDRMIADGVITEFPNTWQDLFALADEIETYKDDMIDDICEVLNKEEKNVSLHKTPEEIQGIKDAFVPFSYDSSANAFITLTRQWGGSYTTIDTSREGVVLFDNDQTHAMLEFVFANRSIFTAPAYWTADYASDLFKVGQTAVTVGSTGGARYNTPITVSWTNPADLEHPFTEATFELGIHPMLYNKDKPENAVAIQQGTNMSIMNTGTDQQKLASWLFLKYLTSKTVQLDFALRTGYSPVRTSVYSDAEYLQYLSGLDGDGKALTGEAKTISLSANAAAAALQSGVGLYYDQAFVGSSDCRTAVGVAYERVVLAVADANAALTIDGAIAYAKSEAERVLGN